MGNQPGRVGAITNELERAVTEYLQTKFDYERARVSFETAAERFSAVKKLAADMLNGSEWHQWQKAHQDVKFAAMPIGEAITDLLRDTAFCSACEVTTKQKQKYDPFMRAWKIAEALEAGGFKFNSTSPRREVNAALMRLKGIISEDGRYKVEDADKIYKDLMDLIGIPESPEDSVQTTDQLFPEKK